MVPPPPIPIMDINTKRAATIAPTNNDNRPSVSTLRDLVNSDFSKLPPPDSIYGLYNIKHFIFC